MVSFEVLYLFSEIPYFNSPLKKTIRCEPLKICQEGGSMNRGDNLIPLGLPIISKDILAILSNLFMMAAAKYVICTYKWPIFHEISCGG